MLALLICLMCPDYCGVGWKLSELFSSCKKYKCQSVRWLLPSKPASKLTKLYTELCTNPLLSTLIYVNISLANLRKHQEYWRRIWLWWVQYFQVFSLRPYLFIVWFVHWHHCTGHTHSASLSTKTTGTQPSNYSTANTTNTFYMANSKNTTTDFKDPVWLLSLKWDHLEENFSSLEVFWSSERSSPFIYLKVWNFWQRMDLFGKYISM